VRQCVRARVRACVRANASMLARVCVCVCVRARMRACVRATRKPGRCRSCSGRTSHIICIYIYINLEDAELAVVEHLVAHLPRLHPLRARACQICSHPPVYVCQIRIRPTSSLCVRACARVCISNYLSACARVFPTISLLVRARVFQIRIYSSVCNRHVERRKGG
jgi:hypothetical protein